MKGKFLHQFFFVFMVLPLSSWAQDYTNFTWYFGNRIVEFNRTNKDPNTSTNTITLAGPAAVAANPATGDVLFYTDGVNVYDATNTIMVNGTGLQANTNSNQPVVLGQVPGQENQYYIITKTATGEIQTTIVDMSLQGNPGAVPLGEVVNATKNTPVPGLVNQSQAMITIPHENGTDFWLITHTQGSPATYNVTLFTSAGPVSTTTYSGLGLIENTANFTYNATTGQIAVSPNEANRNIEILNFNPADGSLSFEADLPLTAVTSLSPDAIYDVAWSPSGQYLYISINGGGQADLIQYDLSNIDPVTGIITPVSILPQPNTITASYGLQVGPDGAIYHLYESGGQIRMGKINEPDNEAAFVNYEQQAIAGTFSSKQFSATLPAHPVTVTIDFTGSGCANVPTQLFPTIVPAADSVQWFITGEEDPFSTAYSPVFTFSQGPTVSVTVIAYLGGEPTSFTKTISIANFDTQITLEPEVTGCHSEFTEPRVKPPGWVPCGTAGGDPCLTVTAQIEGTQGTIRWFGPDGEIANNSTTLTPPSPGYYYMVVSANGCEAYAGVNVKEYDVPDPRANVWFFGNGVGLDFNPLFRDPPEALEPLSNGVMNAPEGTATISDRNGNPIIYTDGVTVWDRNNDVVATNIGGSQTATQSSLIMGIPGDETLYYIFTTQEMSDGTFELRYTLFDLKGNNGNGSIVLPDPGDPTTFSTVLLTRSTERLIAVGEWLIAHEFGNNTFRAYRITPEGISAPVISNIGSDHSFTSLESGEGYMMYGAGRIAVAVNNTVEVFDFNPETGEITNNRDPLVVPGQAYGVNFSPNGNRLYVTLLNNPNEILEFRYDENTETYIPMPSIVMTGQPGAIQYGPDGQLYVAIEGATTLGAIQPQDDENTSSTFLADATPDLGGTVTLGLPNFVQQIANPIQEPGLAVPLVCIDTEAQFVATGKDDTIDEYRWEFSDGIAPDDPTANTVSRTFTVSGTYTVRVKIWNKCEGSEDNPYFDETIQFDVNDLPPTPPMLQPGELPVICDDDGIELFGAIPADPDLTYTWNTGATTPSIIVTRPGFYNVTITSITTGCTNQAEQQINPYFPDFTLGPDLEICEGAPLQFTVPQIVNNPTITWTGDGTATTQNTVFQVNTTTPGPKPIRVVIDDNICSLSDEVLVNVRALPVFTTSTVDTDCNTTNGEIRFDITAPVNIPLSYSVIGNGGFSQSDFNIQLPPVSTTTILNLPGDTYEVIVADQVSGCATNQVIAINNSNLSFTATQAETCHPDIAIDVTLDAGSIAGPYTYEIRDSNNNLERGGTANASPFRTVTLPERDGTYTITVSATGCQFSQPVVIQQGPAYDIFVDNSLLCNLSQVQVGYNQPPADANTFTWTATTTGGTGNGISSASGSTATLVPGTWVVNVRASGPGACPVTATRTVSVPGPILADYTQSDACELPVILSATPTGAPDEYTYRWFRDGTLFGAGASFSLTDPTNDGRSFMVMVIKDGCSDDSEDRPVRIIQPFTVSITPPPFACAGTDFQIVATASRPDVVQFQWFVNGGALTQSGPVLTATQGGVYSVIGSLLGCISDPAETTITPNPRPDVALGPLRRICPYPGPLPTRTALLDPGTGYSSYDWFRVEGNAVIPLNVNTRDYTAEEGGTYRVQITDDDGCPNTADVVVLEDCDPIIVAPNAFRPGSRVDENSGFSVITQFITDEDFQIFIFNRWGEMVYESSQRDFKWNGGYKGNGGQILPAGTYAYVVKYKSEYRPEEGVKEKRGGVVLMR